MALNHIAYSLNPVAEFQMSAIPWISSSIVTGTQQFSFPYVTSFIFIKNLDATSSIQIGFSANGINGSNYLTLGPKSDYSGQFRLRDLWIKTSSATNVEVMAGLTSIPASTFPVLSGSAGQQGIG